MTRMLFQNFCLSLILSPPVHLMQLQLSGCNIQGKRREVSVNKVMDSLAQNCESENCVKTALLKVFLLDDSKPSGPWAEHTQVDLDD